MLVPHPNSKVLSFKIPLLLPKCLLAAGIVAFLVSAYFVHSYNKLADETAELKVFKDISTVQEERIQKLEKETAAVESKLVELNTLDREIREMVGLETPDGGTDREETPSRGTLRPRTALPSGPSGGSPAAEEKSKESEISQVQGEGLEKLAILEKKLQELDQEIALKKELLKQLKTDVQARLAFLNAYPSGWPARGRLTSFFGYRGSPFGRGGSEFHNGLDIANSYGTTIRAAGAGTVVSAGWESGYGQMIIIDHGYGYRTGYGHCSQMLVEVGERVARGDAIGKIGTTGRTTGPHVHFTVSYRGSFINPLEVLK